MLSQFLDHLKKKICFSDNIPHRIFALLSKNVYENSELRRSIDGWSGVLDSSKVLQGETYGYFGAAYIQMYKVIIAHRGTEITDLNDLKADWQLLTTQANQQYALALKFLHEIKSRYPNHTVLHTGHSLGAVLAETLACLNDALAVTFDSPGSFHSIRALASADLQINSVKDLSQRCQITTYLSSPTVLNAFDQHVGTMLRIYVESQSGNSKQNSGFNINSDPNEYLGSLALSLLPKAASDYVSYLMQQHSIENIAGVFNSTLICPIQAKVIKQWPAQLSHVMGYYQFKIENPDEVLSSPELIRNFGYEVSAVSAYIIWDVFGKSFLFEVSNAVIAGASAFLLMSIINSKYDNLQRSYVAFSLLAVTSLYSALSDPWIMLIRLFTSLIVHFLGSVAQIFQNPKYQMLADSLVVGLLVFSKSLLLTSVDIPIQLRQWNSIAKGMGGFIGTGMIEAVMPQLQKNDLTFAGRLFRKVSSRNSRDRLPMSNDEVQAFKRQ